MSKKEAQAEAIRLAIAELASVDLAERAAVLGLPAPQDGKITLRVFGKEMELDSDYNLSVKDTGDPSRPDDRILLLHFLKNEFAAKFADELISFRELTGGQFYWGPFQSRSVKPLVGRIKNDLDLLKKNLDLFDWEEAELKDFSARVHLFGNLYATLVYHLGDEEFPADAELLFDASIKHLFVTEDAAVIASRICIGLL